MNHPLEDDDLPSRYSDRHPEPSRADREISLGTPTILGIFFVLVVVAAAIFGTGYSMGRRSAESVQAATTIDADRNLTSSAASPKPAAGSLAAQPASPSTQPAASDSPVPVETATLPLNLPAPRNTATPSDRILAGDKPSPTPQPTIPHPSPATTTFVVQVAAVSSQEVADILLASLQKKGYTVAVRQEPQDKLLHVQIGPFPDRKQAEAIRARVLADGFNAIVK